MYSIVKLSSSQFCPLNWGKLYGISAKHVTLVFSGFDFLGEDQLSCVYRVALTAMLQKHEVPTTWTEVVFRNFQSKFTFPLSFGPLAGLNCKVKDCLLQWLDTQTGMNHGNVLLSVGWPQKSPLLDWHLIPCDGQLNDGMCLIHPSESWEWLDESHEAQPPVSNF